MVQPRVRVAASVLAVVVVVAAGIAGWISVSARHTALRVDGVVHECPPSGAVSVDLSLEGRGDARFAVDGVEVPSSRGVVAGFPASTSALLTDPVRYLRCDDRSAHRFSIVTPEPGACRWSVRADESQADARAHRGPIASGTTCSVVVGA